MGRFTSVGHRDKAERPILCALTALRASWLQISAKNGPDVVIGALGHTYLLEIKSVIQNTRKDGHTRTSKGKLSEGQKAFHDSWRGGRILTGYTPEEVLISVGFSGEDIARAKGWTKGWTKMLKPEQLAVLERASAGYQPPRGHGVDAAAEAEATFAPPPEWGGPHVCAVGNRSGSWKDCRGRLARLSPAVGAELRCVTHMPEFTEQHLSTLRCQRPGCGDSWGEHDHSESPIPGTEPERCRREGCGCTGYVGMGQASLLSAASD